MPRFYLPPEQCRETTLILAGREAHHALHVLRIRAGERVQVLDGAGGQFECEVMELHRDQVRLKIAHRNFVPEPRHRTTLLQAIPKGKILESVIQKAVELGAHRLVPLLTDHVATRLDPRAAKDKAEKWRLVAIEAIKQCGSAWLPQIDVPQTIPDFLARGETSDLPLIASLQPGSRHARDYFTEYLSAHGRKPASACAWIGPEGDFTPAEVERIQASGARPITLGPLVLRTETAAIYCLSILNHELTSVP